MAGVTDATIYSRCWYTQGVQRSQVLICPTFSRLFLFPCFPCVAPQALQHCGKEAGNTRRSATKSMLRALPPPCALPAAHRSFCCLRSQWLFSSLCPPAGRFALLISLRIRWPADAARAGYQSRSRLVLSTRRWRQLGATHPIQHWKTTARFWCAHVATSVIPQRCWCPRRRQSAISSPFARCPSSSHSIAAQGFARESGQALCKLYEEQHDALRGLIVRLCSPVHTP